MFARADPRRQNRERRLRDLDGRRSATRCCAIFRIAFANARLIGGDAAFEALVAKVVGFVEAPKLGLDLPLDVRGTAFQQRVWRALQAIPAGATASYTDIARAIGAPKAVRAVAGACAANPVALAIPCHRVVRSDGALSGYRWGVARKRALLGARKRLSGARSAQAFDLDRRDHAGGAGGAQIAFDDKLKRAFLGVEWRAVHAVGEDHPLRPRRRVGPGEIQRHLVAVAGLDDDDVDEFGAMDRFAARSADFGEDVAEQRAFESVDGAMLLDADLYSRQGVEFGERDRAAGRRDLSEPRLEQGTARRWEQQFCAQPVRGALRLRRDACKKQQRRRQKKRSHELSLRRGSIRFRTPRTLAHRSPTIPSPLVGARGVTFELASSTGWRVAVEPVEKSGVDRTRARFRRCN